MMQQDKDSELEQLTKQIAKGGGITFVGSIIGKVLIFITTLILARVLGAELLGLYVLGIAVLDLAGIISRLGLHTGSMRFISINHSKGNKERVKGVIVQSLYISFLTGVFFACIVFSLADVIAINIFKNQNLSVVIRLFSIAIPFYSTFLVAASIPRGFKVMRYYEYSVNVFNPLLNIGFLIILFWAGLRLNGAIYARILSIVLAFFCAIYYIPKVFPEMFKKEVKAEFRMSTLLSFSIPLLGTNFLQFLIMWINILMVGYFMSPLYVGIYRVAAQIAILIIIFLSSFNAIFAPLVADLYHKKELDKLNEIFKLTTKWIFYLTIPLFIIVLFCSRQIMTVFGNEFTIGAAVLLILAFAQLVNACTGGVGFALIMSGKERLELLNMLLICTLNIALNLLLIPRYGIIGAAIATGISIIVVNLVRLFQVERILGLFPYDKRYLKGLAGGGMSIAVLFLFKPLLKCLHYSLNIFLVSFIVVTVMALTIIALKLDREDWVILNALKLKLKSA